MYLADIYQFIHTHIDIYIYYYIIYRYYIMQPTEKMQLIAGGPGTAPSFVWLGSYMTALKGHGFSTE